MHAEMAFYMLDEHLIGFGITQSGAVVACLHGSEDGQMYTHSRLSVQPTELRKYVEDKLINLGFGEYANSTIFVLCCFGPRVAKAQAKALREADMVAINEFDSPICITPVGKTLHYEAV